MNYTPAKFATSNPLGDAFPRKYSINFDPDLRVKVTQDVAHLSMFMQCLMLLRPMVWKVMHLQENTLFDLKP